MNRPSWDQLYMTMCYLVAARSRDLSTHAGSVVVATDNTIRSIGYNSLPRGIDFEGEIGEDNLPSRQSKIDNEKYKWFEHAERNSLYNAARNGLSLIGCTLYVNWLPCTDCARGITQMGISKVVVHKQGQEAFLHSRNEQFNIWNDHHNTTLELFNEGNIELQWFEEPLSAPVTGFFTGAEYEFDSITGDYQVIENE